MPTPQRARRPRYGKNSSSCFAFRSKQSMVSAPPSVLGNDVPRYRNQDRLGTPLGQQVGLEQFRALVMQEVLDPMRLHQLGDQHGDLPVGVFLLQFQYVIDDGIDDEAKRR